MILHAAGLYSERSKEKGPAGPFLLFQVASPLGMDGVPTQTFSFFRQLEVGGHTGLGSRYNAMVIALVTIAMGTGTAGVGP
jgi:hypothetical protein